MFSSCNLCAAAASLTSALWDRRAALHQTAIADAVPDHINGWNGAISLLQGAGLAPQQGLSALARQVENQAYNISTFELFWLFGVLSVVMIPLIWLARRSVSGGGAHAAAD